MWQQNQAYYHAHSTIFQPITPNVATVAIKNNKQLISKRKKMVKERLSIHGLSPLSQTFVYTKELSFTQNIIDKN